MTKATSFFLVGLAAFATLATLPDSAHNASIELPAYQSATNAELATTVGGVSDAECVMALAAASTTMKVGGGWLATINPVIGVAVVGLGLLASAATILCAM